jgi:2-oxoisovalerate dehydrogenase E1 component
MCGVGAEIAAAMMELAFDDLDAPIGRIHTDPTAHPFSPAHEGAVVITTERVVDGARAVLAGKPIIPRRLHGVRSKAAASAPAAAHTSPKREPAMAGSSPEPAAATNGQSAKPVTKSGVAVIMPNQDLTITEGKVVGWIKQVGDRVTKGETVAEIETDKAVIAIEAPADGRLVEIVAPQETVVKLGETIGIVEPA